MSVAAKPPGRSVAQVTTGNLWKAFDFTVGLVEGGPEARDLGVRRRQLAVDYSACRCSFELLRDPNSPQLRTHRFDPSLPVDAMDVHVVSARAAANATTADLNSGRAAIGSGPYRFVEWVPGDRIVLRRNERWWDQAMLDRERWRRMPRIDRDDAVARCQDRALRRDMITDRRITFSGTQPIFFSSFCFSINTMLRWQPHRLPSPCQPSLPQKANRFLQLQTRTRCLKHSLSALPI
jgi:hypothetical protein